MPTIWQTLHKRQFIALVSVALMLCSLSMLHSIGIKSLFASPDRHILVQQSLLALCTLALVVLFIRLTERIAQQHVLACRDILFRAMLHAPFQRGPKRLGVAMNRLITDANSLRKWAGPGLANLLTGSLLVIAYGLYFTIGSPQLLPVAGTLLVALAISAGLSRSIISQTEASVRSQRGRLSGHLSERSIQKLSIRRMRRLDHEAKKSLNHGLVLADLLIGLKTVTTFFHTLLITVITLVTLTYIGIHLDDRAAILELLHLPLFAQGILLMHRAWQYFLIYRVAYKRLSLALVRCRANFHPSGKNLKAGEAPGITFRDCKLSRNSKTLVGRFPSGARVLLRGVHDKTALIRALLAEQRPYSGYACLGKRRVSNLNPKRLYKHVMVLDQNFAFFKTSLRRNIAYGQGRLQDDHWQQVCRFLSIPDSRLDMAVPEMGAGLSEQWKIRIMFARTLLARPTLLMIDHPVLLSHPLAKQLLPQLVEAVTATLVIVSEPEDTPIGCEWLIDTDSGFCGPVQQWRQAPCHQTA